MVGGGEMCGMKFGEIRLATNQNTLCEKVSFCFSDLILTQKFLAVDAVNNKLEHFKPMWSYAKQNGFEVPYHTLVRKIRTLAL